MVGIFLMKCYLQDVPSKSLEFLMKLFLSINDQIILMLVTNVFLYQLSRPQQGYLELETAMGLSLVRR